MDSILCMSISLILVLILAVTAIVIGGVSLDNNNELDTRIDELEKTVNDLIYDTEYLYSELYEYEQDIVELCNEINDMNDRGIENYIDLLEEEVERLRETKK